MQKAKFEIGDILPIAITLVVAGIAITFGLQVTDEVGQDIGSDACAGYWNTTDNSCDVSSTNSTELSSNPASFNASNDAIEGVGTLAEKIPLIATVVAAAIIISILVRYLMIR